MTEKSNQSLRHASLLTKLAVYGAGEGDATKYERLGYEPAFHTYWDKLGTVPAGNFNERMVAWINAALAASYSSIVTAQHAYAISKGVQNWDCLGDLGLP